MDSVLLIHLEAAAIGSAIARSPESDASAASQFASLVNPDWFSRRSHQILARSICACVENEVCPDPPTLVMYASGLMDQAEADEVIMACMESSPGESVRAVDHYGRLMREAYSAFLIRDRCLEIAAQVDKFIPGSLGALEASARSICDGVGSSAWALQNIRDVDETEANPKACQSSLPCLNAIMACGGYPSGEYSYWMCPRGTGKTSLLINEAVHASVVQGKRVIFATLEMSPSQIKARTLRQMTGYSIKPAVDIKLREYERALEALNDRGYDILNCAGELSNWARFKAEIIRIARSSYLDFLIIDYVQRFTVPGLGSRTEDLDFISNDMKNLASELEIPILTAAQPTQHMSAQGSMEFTTKHARAIEEHAALIVNVLTKDGVVDCTVGKNRYGESFGKLPLAWDPQKVGFYDAAASCSYIK